jgi:hypothetical protein
VTEHEPDFVETDATDLPVETDPPAEQPQAAAEECAPKKPLWVRVLKGVGITLASVLALLVVGAVLLYNFGGMWGSAEPGVLDQYDQWVATGQAPAIEKRFVIPIPGCKCHSKDPRLTAQHTRRHMNECGKCHNTNPAHMEPGIL